MGTSRWLSGVDGSDNRPTTPRNFHCCEQTKLLDSFLESFMISSMKMTLPQSDFTPEFTLYYPPVIEFGWGAFERLGERIKAVDDVRGPFFLVTSPTFVRQGVEKRLEAVLNEPLAGAFSAVEHDPSLATVDRLIDNLRSSQSGGVIAVGGGSVMDAAKAAAVLAPIPDARVKPYFYEDTPLPGAGLPLITVPTTAGSGAEVTKNAVLTDPETQVKQSLRSPVMVPKIAVKGILKMLLA